MKFLITAIVSGSLALALFAGAAEAGSAPKAYKRVIGSGYTTGGDFGTVIGPKAKVSNLKGK